MTRHRLEQPYFGGSVGIDKAGVKTCLDNATLNGKRVWVVKKSGFSTEVFDDPAMAEAHYNHIRPMVNRRK